MVIGEKLVKLRKLKFSFAVSNSAKLIELLNSPLHSVVEKFRVVQATLDIRIQLFIK